MSASVATSLLSCFFQAVGQIAVVADVEPVDTRAESVAAIDAEVADAEVAALPLGSENVGEGDLAGLPLLGFQDTLMGGICS